MHHASGLGLGFAAAGRLLGAHAYTCLERVGCPRAPRMADGTSDGAPSGGPAVPRDPASRRGADGPGSRSGSGSAALDDGRPSLADLPSLAAERGERGLQGGERLLGGFVRDLVAVVVLLLLLVVFVAFREGLSGLSGPPSLGRGTGSGQIIGLVPGGYRLRRIP